MPEMDKEPHPIDKHVGARVRLRRTLIGMSQEQLGARLGLTFQQVQKYEKGTNRISASRLWQIGRILLVPVEFFFEGAVGPNGEEQPGLVECGHSELTGLAQSNESIQLLRHFTQIGNPKMRRAVTDLAKALAGSSDGAVRSPAA